MPSTRSIRVALWAWHSPYISLLANALPEVTFYTLPTPYCPGGWNYAHRPLPSNVHPHDGIFVVSEFPDVVIAQTERDFNFMPASWDDGPAMIFLGHNRPEMESQSLIDRLNWIGNGSPDGAYVTISPMKCEAWKAAVPNDEWHTILPYVNVEDYGGWTGEGGYILTVANNLRRPLFDKAAWLEATRGLPVKLVGEGNSGIPGAVGPAQSWDDLKSLYRCAAVYLNVTRKGVEDAWNLSLLEAMATGVPCVSTQLDWQLHGVASGTPLRHVVEDALNGDTPWHVDEQRERLAEQFPLDRFRQSWLSVLERVTA